MTLAEIVTVLVVGCVGEIDFPEHADECLLMWHVQGVKVAYEPEATARQVQEYNTIFRAKGKRARWVRSITIDGQRPEHFPRHLRWQAPMVDRGYSRQQSVMRIVTAAYAFLQGETEHPCRKATHYGGRCELRRGACDPPPKCAKRVACGDTSQAYWHYRACRFRSGSMPASLAGRRRPDTP